MTRAAIFDLDGTLCDIGHRLHFVLDGARDWDGFFAGIPDDGLNSPVRDVLVALHERGEDIVLCSGRPERCRTATLEWLARFNVPFARLYMRPDNDTRPDHIIKAQILAGMRDDGYEPFIVIDDRQSVVDMWRAHGLTCLQVAPSEEGVSPHAILTLMVGPSGGGKSSWLASETARAFGIMPAHIISSDQLRAEMCGDCRDQSKNDAVFAALHALAAARLKHGLHTVIDATHLRRRDRVGAAGLAKGRCEVRYIVINRPISDKRRDGGWRNDVKKNGEPFDLIAAHEQTFNSQIKEILNGDALPNVTVVDLRERRMAA